MEDMEFRTVSPAEMERMLANERGRHLSAGDVMKIIGASLCCLFTAAVTALFIYVMLTLPPAETECTMSGWAFVNWICEYGMRVLEHSEGFVIIPISIAAILIAWLCERPVNFLLNKLPLGRFPADIAAALPRMTLLTSVTPALIVGLHITLHALSKELGWTSGLQLSEKILPVTVILSGIIMIYLVLHCMTQTGLWGLILRGSVLLAANFGLAIVFGLLGQLLGMLLIVIAFGLLVLTLLPFLLLFMGISLWR